MTFSRWVSRRFFIACAAFFAGLGGGIGHADLPAIRIAALEFGTVSWELETIRHHGLDRAEGFVLAVEPVASTAAAKIALQGGLADAIVTDWIWAARQRAAGHDYVFLPYSKAIGSLMVPAQSPLESLADLRGRTIGVAGGPLDKSWLLFRALASDRHGLDLMREARPVFAAPPLIHKTALRGDVDASVNYWHFAARAQAAGLRPLLTAAEAAKALGLDPEIPLLGYVIRGDWTTTHPERIAGLHRAARAAKERLAQDTEEWDRLRPRMKAANDAEFDALIAGYRAGIPTSDAMDEAAAARLLALMGRLGGRDLVGTATELPEGLFVETGS